jgi:hypothetical protein
MGTKKSNFGNILYMSMAYEILLINYSKKGKEKKKLVGIDGIM